MAVCVLNLSFRLFFRGKIFQIISIVSISRISIGYLAMVSVVSGNIAIPQLLLCVKKKKKKKSVM